MVTAFSLQEWRHSITTHSVNRFMQSYGGHVIVSLRHELTPMIELGHGRHPLTSFSALRRDGYAHAHSEEVIYSSFCRRCRQKCLTSCVAQEPNIVETMFYVDARTPVSRHTSALQALWRTVRENRIAQNTALG